MAMDSIVTEEDVLATIDYIKLYWRNPTHWTTPHGMLNLSIIFQVLFGMWFFHNSFWHLSEVPSYFTLCLTAFVFVKYPFFAAIVINKKPTNFMRGTLVGSSVMLIISSFSTAIFWARSSSCHNHHTENMVTTRVCSESLMSSMKTEFYLSIVIFFLQMHFAYMALLVDAVDDEDARARVSGGAAASYHHVQQQDESDFEFKHPMNYGLEQFGTRNHDEVRLPPGPSLQHTPL